MKPCPCGRATPASAFDRALFGWVAVGPGHVCRPCLDAPSRATGVAPHAVVRVLRGQSVQETTHAAVCAEARRLGLIGDAPARAA